LGTAQPPVNPEKIWDYEVGLKTTISNGRLRVNLSGFYYDYQDLQVNKVVFTSVLLENAAAARIYGLEAEIVAKPTKEFQIDFSGSYLHSEFTRFISADSARPGGDGRTVDEFGNPAFNLRGNRLPQSPTFSGKLGASYTIPIGAHTFTLRGEAAYTGKVYWTPYNLDTTATNARTRFNLSAVFETGDHRWTASLNVRNLTNKVVVTNGFVTTQLVGFAVNGYVEQPRTIDFTLGYRF
jgi:iron complex outermembrane receptor protein